MKISYKFLTPLLIAQAGAAQTKRQERIIEWVRDGAHLTAYVGDMVKRRAPEKSRAWRIGSYADTIFTLVILGALAAQTRIWLGRSLGAKKSRRPAPGKISTTLAKKLARHAGYTGPIADLT